MTCVARVVVDDRPIHVDGIEGLDALRAHVASVTGRHLAAGSFEHIARKCIDAVVRAQEPFFRKGPQRAAVLTEDALDAMAPGIAGPLFDELELLLFGDRFPARLLVQRPVRMKVGAPIADIAARVEVIKLLLREPFADRTRLSSLLAEHVAEDCGALVASTCEILKIMPAVFRVTPGRAVEDAIELLVPTRWFAKALHAYLRPAIALATAECPWPRWWQSFVALESQSDEQLTAPLPGREVVLSSAAFVRIAQVWAAHGTLAIHARDAGLEAPLAEILSREVETDSVDVARDAAAVFGHAIGCGVLPETQRVSAESVTGEQLAELLRVAPRAEWRLVLQRLQLPDSARTRLLVEAVAVVSKARSKAAAPRTRRAP